MRKPLAIDGYCGLGGWTEGLLAEGWDVVGIDIERHVYGDQKYPAQMILQDMLTVHGSQFAKAELLCFSPPCQKYSWLAMPWSRSKDPNNSKAAKALRAEWEANGPDNRLFNACFRIQREACEAAGRYIPLIVENVRGAQPWVGPAQAKYGSMYLWGDVPTLMPYGSYKKQSSDGSWFYDNYANSARRFGSKSKQRKFWSASIAKIPFDLASHIARCYKPDVRTEE